jgi:hypothetical protein
LTIGALSSKYRVMHSKRVVRWALPLVLSAGFVALPSAVRAEPRPASPLCGGDKKKDVKKPTDDEKKKPPKPA